MRNYTLNADCIYSKYNKLVIAVFVKNVKNLNLTKVKYHLGLVDISQKLADVYLLGA